MPRVDQLERTVGYFRDHGLEPACKCDLGLDNVQFGQCLHRCFDSVELAAEGIGQLREYPRRFALLFRADVLQFVVRLNSVERFNEGGRT